VNWLRAKSCVDRWQEEFDLVNLEMGWTMAGLRALGQRWTALKAKACYHTGHHAYAAKQEAMWLGMAETARTVFERLTLQ
jgi:hypothetical protein